MRLNGRHGQKPAPGLGAQTLTLRPGRLQGAGDQATATSPWPHHGSSDGRAREASTFSEPADRRATVRFMARRQVLAIWVGALMFFTISAAPSQVAAKTHANWIVGYIPDKPFDVPKIDKSRVPPHFHQAEVDYAGSEPAGTIIVDTGPRFLYLVKPGGKALRFGIAVGRSGMGWTGEARVGRKAKWPGWTPTANMRKRNPKLPRHVPGGPSNPLGARALYLYLNGADTLYRIHGTNEPWSVGQMASSGCIRMLNQHVYELYEQVAVGARVIVR